MRRASFIEVALPVFTLLVGGVVKWCQYLLRASSTCMPALQYTVLCGAIQLVEESIARSKAEDARHYFCPFDAVQRLSKISLIGRFIALTK